MKVLKIFQPGWFKNKRILITGHTGFKGAWMSRVLQLVGADVVGYAQNPPTEPSLFDMCRLDKGMRSYIGDIRDIEKLMKFFAEAKPEIVIHMAAQPIVRESYKKPVYTYDVNVMGTVNVLECIRNCSSVRSFVNVTTDKVYLNKEWEWGYRENEELNGYDPYSNSKSCSELVTSSYVKSFFYNRDIAISTCRAGNVIGGGDFSSDRIIPDCIRAALAKEDIVVRNPLSVRPYQHVLEPVIAYLMIAQAQYNNKTLAGSYNIGPDDSDCWTTGRIVDCFCQEWTAHTGEDIKWINKSDGGPHEANLLRLDCSKLKKTFGWNPRWDVRQAIGKIVEMAKCYYDENLVMSCMDVQISEYLKIGCKD